MKATEVAKTKWGDIEFFSEDVFVGKSLREYGWYSMGEITLFEKALNPQCVVVEVGANIGSLTVPISRMAGYVLAFEPQPQNFELLSSNVRRNGLTNTWVRHTAIGSSRGLTNMPYLEELHPQGNFGGIEVGQGTYPVAVETLDDVCRDLKVPKIDLIKVDVEGYEREVFKGAVSCIFKFRPALYFENDRKEKSRELLEFVRSLEYRMYHHQPRLDEGADRNIWDHQFASYNILAVPREGAEIVGLEPVAI